MGDSSTNLLSADDFRQIETFGPYRTGNLTIVSFTGDEKPVFTMKGLQFYSVLCAKLGMSEAFKKVKTRKDLTFFNLQAAGVIMGMRNEERARQIEEGEIPLQDVELTDALMHGSLEEVKTAVDRNLRFSQAGQNVIPVAFAKKM